MPEPSTSEQKVRGTVFLSYASEDAAAAHRIATALRAAGIEVWFDKSELRGGDAWDRQIRQQIHDCRLFIPVISSNSERREEGYFRREWGLAVDRTRDMAHKRAFLVPVVIDGTPERGASVPEKFLELQWSRLPAGETPPEFVERVARLLAPALPESAATANPAPAAATHATTDRRRPFVLPRATVLLALAAVAVLALSYVVLDRWVLPKHSVSRMALQSIAVLPLVNESGDGSQQYFSDGLAEDLITALSQIQGLKVIGRSSSFQFRDAKEGSKTIGEKLGVAHLVEGSVRRSGDIVRVSAALVSAVDGSTEWSENYDRPYKDLFALQDEITHTVAGALRIQLVQGKKNGIQSDRPPSGSLDAYNAVLEGRYYLARNTESDTRKAIERFTFATHLDPRYGLAWSSVSWAWTRLGDWYLDLGEPEQEAYAKARVAADTALSLAPELAGAHVARGYVLTEGDLNWRGAEAEYRRALELAPGDGDAKVGLAERLATFGQVERAIALIREALVVDPLRASYYQTLAICFQALQRPDEAERAIRKAIELQPGAATYHKTLANIEIQRGDARAALAAAQGEFPSLYRAVALALALQIGSDRPAADAALRNLIDYPIANPYYIAQVYAVRNDVDKTFEWLDRAWTDRDSTIDWLLIDPFILRYKDDPRFTALCRKMGLPTPAEVGRQ